MSRWSSIGMVLLALTGVAVAQSTNQSLAVGSAAPDFAAVGTNDQTNRLADLKGKWVVLYFYPKAFTPGCTSEACSLRDGYAEIQKTGAVIFGVSLDALARLKEFKQAYSLPFDLLSDSDKSMSRDYRTLGFGGMFAERRTFIISPDGVIAHIFESVNTRTHDRQVVDALAKLQAARLPAAPASPLP